MKISKFLCCFGVHDLYPGKAQPHNPRVESDPPQTRVWYSCKRCRKIVYDVIEGPWKIEDLHEIYSLPKDGKFDPVKHLLRPVQEDNDKS